MLVSKANLIDHLLFKPLTTVAILGLLPSIAESMHLSNKRRGFAKSQTTGCGLEDQQKLYDLTKISQ